jgi:hypothetical protein
MLFADGPEAQLRMPRDTELPDDDDVERSAEGRGDLRRDGDAAARDRADDWHLDVRLDRSGRQLPTRVRPISKHLVDPFSKIAVQPHAC